MAIPEDIKNKFEHHGNRTVEHEDIVRVMDENRKEKPWSRYMIQQSLEQDTTRATVNDRLKELVELDILDKYEYQGNTKLYDLAYDPIVTDGGRLKHASLMDLATFREPRAIEELALAGPIYSLIFLLFGALFGAFRQVPSPVRADNFLVAMGIMMMLFTLLLFTLLHLFDLIRPVVSNSKSGS